MNKKHAPRFGSELVGLFGQETVVQARRTDIVDLDLNADFLDDIADIAEQLVAVKNQPERQREIVSSLDSDKSLALCMWVMDAGMVGKLVCR